MLTRARAYHRDVLAYIERDEVLTPAENAALRKRRDSLDLAVEFVCWRRPGETFKDYKARRLSPQLTLDER